MKKLFLLTMLLITTSIISCGNTTTEHTVTPTTENPTTQTPTTTQTTVKESTFTIEKPSSIEVLPVESYIGVGDIINLDDYVEVIGVSNGDNFNAELVTPETAKLDGHNLTVTGEGIITVNITASNYNEYAKFECMSISAFEKAFKEKTNTINTYYLEFIAKDGSTGENILPNSDRFMESRGILHNSRYFAKISSKGYSGILQAKSGKTYNFNCSDLNGKNLEVEREIQKNIEYYDFMQKFPLNYHDLEIIYDEETNEPIALITTDNDIISNYCHIAYDGYSPLETVEQLIESNSHILDVKLVEQQLKVTFVSIDEPKTLENSLPLISLTATFDYLYAGKTEYTREIENYSNVLMYINPEKTKIDGVEKYIDSGEEPEQFNCNLLADRIIETAATRNYTHITTCEWSQNSRKVEDPGIGLPNKTVSQYVTEDTIYTEFKTNAGTAKSFYTIKDQQLYTGNNYVHDDNGDVILDTNNNPSIQEQFNINQIEGSTSIWDDPQYSTLTLAAISDRSLYDSITPKNVTTGNSSSIYELGVVPTFAKLLISFSAGIGKEMDAIFEEYNYYDYATTKITCQKYEIYFAVDLQFDQGYHYTITSSIMFIGTTETPDLSALFS